MLRNFSWNVWPPNNPAALLRLGVGLFAAANLVAGFFVLRPIGGSPDELRQQLRRIARQDAADQPQRPADEALCFASAILLVVEEEPLRIARRLELRLQPTGGEQDPI